MPTETIPPATPNPPVATPPPAAPTPPVDDPNLDPNAPPAEPPAEPPVAVVEEPVIDDPLLLIALRDLRGEPPALPEAEPAPEPPTEPAAVVPPVAPAAEPPATPPAAKPAKKVVRSAKGNAVVDGPPPVPIAPVPLAPVAPPPPAADAALTDDQREELEEALVAERLFPDRYKGYSEKLRTWHAGFDTRARELLAKNPNLTPGDDEYQALLNTKPTVAANDSKKVQRAIGEDLAVKATEKKFGPKIERIEQDARRASILPQVNKFVGEGFVQQVGIAIMGDAASVLGDPLKVYVQKVKEGKVAEYEAEYPLEHAALSETLAASQVRLRGFLMLRNQAETFDPNNQVHRSVSDFISDEGRAFAERGGDYRIKDRRSFLPRSEFIAMLENDQAEAKTFDRDNWRTGRYWTFTDSGIVDMMAIRTKQEAEKRVSDELKRAEKMGFQRVKGKKVVEEQPKPATELKPPQSRPAAAPGPAAKPLPTAANDDSPIPVATVVGHLKMEK